MSDSLQERVSAGLGAQYEIESEIGRGGMSVVYRARDRRLNRPVAIKVLPPELAHDPAIRTRFTREAQMAAQLTHAHIVPIYDVGEQEGLAYFVMAIVHGGNLGTLLMHEPRQPIEEARRLLSEIADALAYAHLRGVIHRDIKPDNILLDESSGRAMVTDFGIARAMEVSTRLTATGIAVGTPAYMSPEQALGDRDVDGRSDIYSLGVLGYQMLTGRLPFTAGNSMALLLKHVSEPPRPIGELRPEAPRTLRDAIERALTKSPEDRWPTATAMRDALLSDRGAPAWRAEQREPVRYTSPRPDGPRAELRAVSPRRGSPTAEGKANPPLATRLPNGIVLEPEHLASLTPSQRADLRLWHGRVNLMDRIKAMRGYTVLTLGATVLAGVGVALGVDGAVPLILSPVVPLYMGQKLWRRGHSLRESGLRLRRVLLMPRARKVIPRVSPTATDRAIEKLAPREVLDGPHGVAIRRAVEDRAAILELWKRLSKEEQAQLPDLPTTVNALVERVASLAQMALRVEQSVDPRLIEEIGSRITAAESEVATPELERRLSLLRRQRATFNEIIQRRVTLSHQIDNVGLALSSLRLDLINLRSSGLQSALAEVSTATQEARALSREISAALEAAEEVKRL